MRQSSLMAWSATPCLNTSRQELANDQNVAGTWARIAWLSGRGVPSRAARANSAFMASFTVAGSTYEIRCLGMGELRSMLPARSRCYTRPERRKGAKNGRNNPDGGQRPDGGYPR